MKKRGIRDQLVIATKFTTCYRAGHGDKEILINTTGNGTKSLHLSVEASLKKLQTDYIDLVCLLSVALTTLLDTFLMNEIALRPLVGLDLFH